MNRNNFYSVWMFFGFYLFFSAHVESNNHKKLNEVQSFQLLSKKKQTIFIVHGTQKPLFSSFELANPKRIVLDFREAHLKRLSSVSYETGAIRHVNVQQFSGTGSSIGRIILHVQGIASWKIRTNESKLSIVLQHSADFSSPSVAQKHTAPSQQILPSTVRKKFLFRSGIKDVKHLRKKGRWLSRISKRKQSLSFLLGGVAKRYEIIHLDQPKRMVVDLFGIRKAKHLRIPAFGCEHAPISSVRIGKHPHKLRMVLDLCSNTSFPRLLWKKTGFSLLFPKKQTTVFQTMSLRSLGLHEGNGFSSISLQFFPDLPRYSVKREGSLFWLHLHATNKGESIESKSVDTSYFRGPFQSVYPFQQGNEVVLRIRMKQNVKPQIQERGSRLVFSFPISQKALTSSGKSFAQISKAKSYEITHTPKKVAQDQVDQSSGKIASGSSLTNKQIMETLAKTSEVSQYTGKKISLYFNNVSAKQILNVFAEFSGFNMIISPSVKGSIALKLREVPWDQALDLVMKTLKLGMEKTGNIIRVAPLKELQKEEEEKKKLEELKLMNQPQKVRIIPVNYATVGDMSGRVKSVLSTKGTVTVDNRTNLLIVKDYVPYLIRAESLVKSLDLQTPQLVIEARVVQASDLFVRNFGIQWGGHILASPTTGADTGLVFPNPIGIRGGNPQTAAPQGGFGTPNYFINFPIANDSAAGVVNLLLGSLTGIANLDFRLGLAEDKSHAKVISSPKVITLHKQPATISQGVQIPYVTTSAAGTQTTFSNASLSLSVTPQVTAEGSIFLDVNVSQSAPGKVLNGLISMDTASITTKILVGDGETMVLGGIHIQNEKTSYKGIPYLSSIPILGALFRSHGDSTDRTEMLIFITPRIINRSKTATRTYGN